jgi:acetyl esterase
MHGRLADPDCTIGTDPRADPRMVKALASVGLDGHMPVPKVTPDSAIEHRLAVVAASERRMDGVFEEFARNLPVARGVATMRTTIADVDGNDIRHRERACLHTTRREKAAERARSRIS